MKKLLLLPSIALLICFGLFTSSAHAQEHISIKETMSFISAKVPRNCELKLKKSMLTATFSKGGSVYREDKVNLKEIDVSKIEFLVDENGVVLRCKADNDECITRKLQSRGIIRGYDRMVFEVDEETAKSLTKAFIHLVKSLQDDDYQSAEPFE